MYRYTLLSEFNELNLYNEELDFSKLKSELTSESMLYRLIYSECECDKDKQLFKPLDFVSAISLSNIAKANLYNMYDELFHYVEIDIYNIINFTCDYLLSFDYTSDDTPKKKYIDDAIEYWVKNDIYFDPDLNIRNTFIKNFKKLKLPFEDMIIVETNGKTTKKIDPQMSSIKIQDICTNYSKYIVKNAKKLYFYGTKSYDAFLLNRFLDAEMCDFKHSDYYILECLTNVNSVITISDFLNKILPTTVAKNLMSGEFVNFKFKNELDNLIKLVANSPLVFSKSLMLYKLFEKAEQIFDVVGESNYVLRYVAEQFYELNKLFTYSTNCGVKGVLEKFSNYCEKPSSHLNSNLSEVLVECIKDKNTQEFNEKYLYKYDWIRHDKLIKNKYIMPPYCDNKANTLYSYINVYVQKKFIEFLESKKESYYNKHS